LSVIGLVVEYNPFHNGHLYHFNTTLDITQAEYSVCVISGNFVQRGEPAIVNKWSRAHMALNAGIDLIIELPVIFCVQSAEIFAYGAVSLLDKLGIVDAICFGSEIGDINVLKKLAAIISKEPEEYKNYIRAEINKGSSFAVSRSKALVNYFNMNNINTGVDINNLELLMQSSNNILALEYIKWLIRLKSTITPITIKRIHSNYNDETLENPIASATAIRKAIAGGDLINSISQHVPNYVLDIMVKDFMDGKGPVFIEDFFQPILCLMRRMSEHELSDIMDVNEGLENRIKKAAIKSSNLNELIDNIKSKRYAETRIRRILIHALLGLKKNDLTLFKNTGGPQYVRVLGFSEKGKNLLSKMKSTCPIPVITNTSDYKKYDNKYISRMIEFDIASTDIYTTSYKNSSMRIGGYDFYNKPEMI
jgi:predicted nucleotidyltransferase